MMDDLSLVIKSVSGTIHDTTTGTKMPDLYVTFISRSPWTADRWPFAVMPLAVAYFPLQIYYGNLTEKQRKHSVSRMPHPLTVHRQPLAVSRNPLQFVSCGLIFSNVKFSVRRQPLSAEPLAVVP